MKHERPVERLRRWIEEQLALLPPGAAFPTELELARQWNISRRSVGRLLSRFAEQGRLIRIPGKGTFVPGPGSDETEPAPAFPNSSSERLEDTIYRSLCAGELKSGEALPSIKYMSRRFRLSPATVIRAYRRLCNAGIVTRVGKTFWIGTFRDLIHGPGGKKVFLFYDESEDFGRIFRDDTLAMAYRKMEDVLSSGGYLLHFEQTGNLGRLARSWVSSRSFPYGLIFYSFDPEKFRTGVSAMASLLSTREGKELPIVVDWRWGHGRPVSRRMHQLSRHNVATTVARLLARYLVEKGYRRVVFFLELDKQSYEVDPMSVGAFWNALTFCTEIKRLDQRFECGIVAIRPSARVADRRVLSRVDRQAAESLLGKYTPTSFETVENEIRYMEESADRFGDLSSSTLWVFERDFRAAEALEWLGANRRRAPNDVSIIGLQNDPAYYHLGISRVEADWEGIGYLMAHAIMGDFAVPRTTRGFIRVGAKLMRKSTSK